MGGMDDKSKAEEQLPAYLRAGDSEQTTQSEEHHLRILLLFAPRSSFAFAFSLSFSVLFSLSLFLHHRQEEIMNFVAAFRLLPTPLFSPSVKYIRF